MTNLKRNILKISSIFAVLGITQLIAGFGSDLIIEPKQTKTATEVYIENDTLKLSLEKIPKETVEEAKPEETIAETTASGYTEPDTTAYTEPINEETTEVIETEVIEEIYTESTDNVYTEPDDSALRYMSAIIYAEAGDQCYAGQCAVGIVVMNRIRNDEFPDNLYDVLYQRGQFTPTVNGSFDKALYLYDTNQLPDSCIEAAIYALNGNVYIEYDGESIDMSSYHFFMMSMRNYRLHIQDHYFK